MAWNMPAGAYALDRSEIVTLECPECGETWAEVMYYEYGGWTPGRPDGWYCPNCGEIGEEV